MNGVRKVLELSLCMAVLSGAPRAWSDDRQLETGRKAILSRSGCYLVDYSYAETESLRSGYSLDPRVYDVNRDKLVKEWIYAEESGPTRIRLQHVLFTADLEGSLKAGSLLKHQAEDWEFDSKYLYEFIGPAHWEVQPIAENSGSWTRSVTSLDDGLRYQCAGQWRLDTRYPEWSCDNYAPIPGRETRDMGRKDYNTLQRSTRIIAYEQSWLERQNNIKTIHVNGVRTPLAREVGKDWYVRIPDQECAAAQVFVAERIQFWHLLKETWGQVLLGDQPFVERTLSGAPPRYARMFELEARFKDLDLTEPVRRQEAQTEILKVIAEYRSN